MSMTVRFLSFVRNAVTNVFARLILRIFPAMDDTDGD